VFPVRRLFVFGLYLHAISTELVSEIPLVLAFVVQVAAKPAEQAAGLPPGDLSRSARHSEESRNDDEKSDADVHEEWLKRFRIQDSGFRIQEELKLIAKVLPVSVSGCFRPF
jgi:hypothetical protein